MKDTACPIDLWTASSRLDVPLKDGVIVHIGALIKRTNSDEGGVHADDVLDWGTPRGVIPSGPADRITIGP